MAINNHTLEKTGDVAVEGGTLHFRWYEPHDPEKAKRLPLVVLHGGPGGSHGLLYATHAVLADERPCVFYDQLGSYFSPAALPPERLRLECFVQDLDRLLSALGVQKVALLGHSWGAGVAARYAIDHPERVARLILSCPYLSTERWVNDCQALLSAFPKALQEVVRACEAQGRTNDQAYEDAIARFSEKHYCRLAPLPAALVKNQKKTNKAIYNAMWGPSEITCSGSLKDFDLFPDLPKIRCPTCLVCGEFDTATPSTMAQARDLIADAELHVLSNCAHVPFLESNEGYLSPIQAFLAAAEAADATSCSGPSLVESQG